MPRRWLNDPRAEVEFRKAYRAMLERGMKSFRAARALGCIPRRIHDDLYRHPLSEPVPDVDGLLTIKEIAQQTGQTVVQVYNAINYRKIKPAVMYCHVRWFYPSVVQEMTADAKRTRPDLEAVDDYDDFRMRKTNVLTRKIYEFERGESVGGGAWRKERCISPAKAERELAAFRDTLLPADFRRLKSLMRFRVAVFEHRTRHGESG